MYFMPQRFLPPWTVERIEGGNESAELLTGAVLTSPQAVMSLSMLLAMRRASLTGQVFSFGSAPFCPLSWIAHQ